MNKRQILILVLAAGIGLAGGFALRSRRALSLKSNAPVASAQQNRGTPAKHHSTPPDDSPLATKLQHDLATATGVTRWLLWLDALEKATPADFPRLARLAHDRPAELRFVAARWAELAPRHFFDTLVAAHRSTGGSLAVRDLGYLLLRPWAAKDPEAAIAALNEAKDVSQSYGWRHEVVNGVLGTDVERGLRLMAEWHIENYGPSMSAIAKWAAADPQHAAEFTLGNAVGYAAQLTMQTIGKEWAKTAPADALTFAAARSSQLSLELGSSALKQWASKNLDAPADWLATTDSRTRTRLSPAFVETWAKQDAAGALAWCQENLTGSSLAQSVAGVLKGAADKNASAAAALVAGMDPSPARSAAAAVVADKLFPDLGGLDPIKPETVAWVAGLDDDARRRVLDKVTWEWASSDPFSMAKFMATLTPDQVPPWTDSILARQMAHKAPSQAIAWAANLPGERGVDAGAEAFAEWRNSQPDAAMKWFDDLPSTDPRREPFFRQVIQTLAFHPQAAEQLGALNPSERATARDVLKTMPYLPEDRRASLLQVLAER